LHPAEQALDKMVNRNEKIETSLHDHHRYYKMKAIIMQSIRIMAYFVEHQQGVAQIPHDIAGFFRLKIFLTMSDNTFYSDHSKTVRHPQPLLWAILKEKGGGIWLGEYGMHRRNVFLEIGKGGDKNEKIFVSHFISCFRKWSDF
jgi:hypothetical protein